VARRTFIILLSLLSFFPAYAQDISSLLEELDECIKNKEDYRYERLHRIDSLRCRIGMKEDTNYELYNELFQSFSHFQADSALHYLDLMSQLDVVKKDPSKEKVIQLNRAEQFAIMGAYNYARDIVESIDRSDMSQENLTRYFHICRTIYGWVSAYQSNVPELSKKMALKAHQYRDSIMLYEQDEISREVVHADYLIAEGQPEAAKKIMLNYQAKATSDYLAYTYYNLAQACKALKDKDNQMRYLIKTAIEDLKRGVTEYAALPDLVQLLMDRGDTKHAYDYMLCSMNDANYCNAQLRSLEMSQIYPIIEKEHNQHEAEEKTAYRWFSCGLAGLAILLAIASLYLRKEAKILSRTKKQLAETNEQLAEANNQLEEANSQLEDANQQLEDANKNLEDANKNLETANTLLGKDNQSLLETNTNLHQMDKVKEEYIALFLSKCRKYITSLESYRKSLLRLAKNNLHTELLKTLKDDSLVEIEEERFYKDFDEAFLEIHPNFVERFNALLNDDSRIVLKKNELLNAELRIFALIRLGITDTNQIAEFLNYSMPTIYNYRSRIRNKSKYSKEEFEEKVMEL